MLEKFEELMAPANKMTELTKAQLEKYTEAQQSVAKEYMAITEERLEAVKGITDLTSLNAFVIEQLKLAQNGIEKIFDESKKYMQDAKTYNLELISLIQERNSTVTKEVKETIKKTSRKAA